MAASQSIVLRRKRFDFIGKFSQRNYVQDNLLGVFFHHGFRLKRGAGCAHVGNPEAQALKDIVLLFQHYADVIKFRGKEIRGFYNRLCFLELREFGCRQSDALNPLRFNPVVVVCKKFTQRVPFLCNIARDGSVRIGGASNPQAVRSEAKLDELLMSKLLTHIGALHLYYRYCSSRDGQNSSQKCLPLVKPSFAWCYVTNRHSEK